MRSPTVLISITKWAETFTENIQGRQSSVYQIRILDRYHVSYSKIKRNLRLLLASRKEPEHNWRVKYAHEAT